MEIYLKSDNQYHLTGQEKYAYEHEAGYRLLSYAMTKFSKSLSHDHLQLAKTTLGKPYFKNYPDIQFNISHTAGLIVCILGHSEVGIDAEKVRTFPKLVLRKMTENEQAYILNADNRDEAFMRVWTMKEAYIKMTGEGLKGFQHIECIPGQAIDGVVYRQFQWQNQYVITAMEKVI